MDRGPVYETPNGVCVLLHVKPGASADRIHGVQDGRWSISVAAPPVDGKCNQHIVVTLAKTLGVHKADVSLAAGSKSRDKVILVSKTARVTAEDISSRLMAEAD